MSDPGMKILTLDIETAPNTAHVWGLFKQTVSLNQLLESSYVMSFAAKWYHEKKVQFFSVHKDPEEMLAKAHELMSEADAIVTWNGESFDIPILNKELWLAGYAPPAPSKQIDLLRVVKRRFRFVSNKLQYVATVKGLEGKLQHAGHEMWVKCMSGDAKAWRMMEKYNKQDVVITEQLYDELKPWIGPGLNAQLFVDDEAVCPGCVSLDLRREGFVILSTGRYQRYQCRACGLWSRSTRRQSGASLVGVAP